MGKTQLMHSMQKLTHAECRARVCLICFQVKPKKSIREISNQEDWILHLKTVVGPHFDINDQRHPTVVCDGCRKKCFSSSAIEDKEEIILPQYLYRVVITSKDEYQTCECIICLKVRPQNCLDRLPELKTGKRPPAMQTLQELRSDGKISKEKSPDSLYGCCLSLRGPEHDPKRCSENTKVDNALKMAIVEGNPTPFGEKVASCIIRIRKASPHGTIRLAIPKAGSRLPITLGAAKPPSEKVKYSKEDVWNLQLKKGLSNDTTKEVMKFINKAKRGTVEPGTRDFLKDKLNVCKPFFEKTEVEIFNEKTKEMEKKDLLHVKDLSDFLQFVIEERNLVYQDTESLMNIDKGGS